VEWNVAMSTSELERVEQLCLDLAPWLFVPLTEREY
jgi:hypothetical protein